MSHCQQCPFKRTRDSCPSETHRSPRPLLAILGEAPSFSELREGRPLSPRSASGRLLSGIMNELQLNRSECWIGNAVNCDAHTKKELERTQPICAGRLIEELAALPPEAVIVPLGSAALRSLLGKKAAAVMKYRGSVTRFAAGPLAGRLMIPTVHPAHALRVPAYRDVIKRDLARALELQEHDWISPELAPGREMHVVRELDELESRLAGLGDEVAFDVETLKEGPLWTPLVCFALSDGWQTLVLPWSATRAGTGDAWNGKQPKVAQLVTECFKSRLTVGHNSLQFDWLVAERYGIFPGSHIADTLIGFHSAHGTLLKNLGFVASYYEPVPSWKQNEDLHADLPRLYTYNGRDALFTRLAWDGVKRDLEAA